MAHEKQYTAKQVTLAVLGKVEELLKKSDLKKYEAENSQKPNAKASEHNSKDADQHAEGKGPKGEIKPQEKEQAPPDGTQPTEKAVPMNGNPDWGSDPVVRGHFKLAKFIGHMEAKRKMKVGIHG